jgi:hypothetical protein
MRPAVGVSLLACVTAIAAAQASGQSFAIPAELWDRPRSSATVMGQPSIRQAVAAWLAQPAARVVIRHGPGQEAQLQAEEIRTWLTALALESERLTLRGDLKGGEPLQLEIQRD